LLFAALAALGASSAHALLISSTADDFDVSWSALAGTNLLAAHATFDVTSFSSTQIVFSVTISNDSVLTTFVNAGLASFGLQTAPKASSASIAGASVFQSATIDNIPSLNFINMCVWAGNNCNGGPQGQLLAVGQSDSFTLTLNSTTGGFANGLDVIDSGVKFQTSGGSFEFTGSECLVERECAHEPPPQLPEPGTLALVGLGLLAVVPLRRRARV
jgi:hypothetical protein